MHDLECSSSSCRFLEQKEKKEEIDGGLTKISFKIPAYMMKLLEGSNRVVREIQFYACSHLNTIVLYCFFFLPFLYCSLFFKSVMQINAGGSFAYNVFTSIRSVCTLNWNGVVILSAI